VFIWRFGAAHDGEAPAAEFKVQEGWVVAGVGPEVGVRGREAMGAGDGSVECFCGEGRGEDEGGVDLWREVSRGLGGVFHGGCVHR
jgi:hypothetical protein